MPIYSHSGPTSAQEVTLYDGSGNLITSTLNGADRGLDINVINDTVVVTDGGSQPTNFVPIGGGDGANARVAFVDTSGRLYVLLAGMSGGATAVDTAYTVDGTAVQVASADTTRRAIVFQNLGTTVISLGFADTVAVGGANTGILLAGGTVANDGKGGSYQESGIGVYTGDWWAESSGSNSNNLLVTEISE